jgi:hypothetical protein
MTSFEAFSLKVLGSDAPSSTIGWICRPSTPPLAFTSEIAISVASASDFSTMDSPPVCENSTPTFTASAARAERWKKYGDASAPAAPILKAVRRVVVIF